MGGRNSSIYIYSCEKKKRKKRGRGGGRTPYRSAIHDQIKLEFVYIALAASSL